MYYSFFTAYVVAGLTLSLLVVFWALRNGQFKDQQRARFLPLEEEPERQYRPVPKVARYETYALGFLAFAGLVTSGAILVMALLHS